MEEASPVIGVFVVRAWREDHSATGLRARITRTLDVRGGEQVTSVVASTDDACRELRAWMDELRPARPPA